MWILQILQSNYSVEGLWKVTSVFVALVILTPINTKCPKMLRQTLKISRMEIFKSAHANGFILDAWLGSEYAYIFNHN